MSRPGTTVAPPSRGGPDRFQNLLTQLQEEHEREIRRLRADNERLNDEVRRLGGGMTANQELREVAKPRIEAPQVQVVDIPADGLATDAKTFVTVQLHGIKALPLALVQEGDEEGGLQCQAVARAGTEVSSPEWISLHREVWKANPNSVGGEMTVEGRWEDPVCLTLPLANLNDDVMVDLMLPGHKKAFATAHLKGSSRHECRFDYGGSLDAEMAADLEGGSKLGSKEKSDDKFRSINVQPATMHRLLKLFRVRDETAKVVLARDVGSAIKATKQKNKHLNVSMEPTELEEILQKMRDVHNEVFGDHGGPKKKMGASVMPWKAFLSCLLLEKLPDYAHGQVSLRLFTLQKSLLGEDCPNNRASQAIIQAYEQVRKPVTNWQRSVLIVTTISTILIALSFIATGVSLDYSPNWSGWFYVDSSFAVLFMSEVVIKFVCMGTREFFCGREKWWNLFDTSLSIGAAAEIVYQVVLNGASTPSRIALTMRVIRLARVSFYMRLINTPLLQELSNIVQGFIIAIPSLFWVMLTLLVIVYVSALGMRATVETLAEGTQGPETCGSGDSHDIFATMQPECGSVAELYGKEYCGTVLGCMFTIFRCMIGDCTSGGGRSLPIIWSQGYGPAFDLFYSFCMVWIIFGMFNIITGIFVEATMNGLKDQETHRKYAQAYESSYMTEQLAKLVICISEKVRKNREGQESIAAVLKKSFSSNSFKSNDSPKDDHGDQELFLTEEEFIQAIRSSDVRMILDDLDVSVEPRPGVFEAFTTQEDGTVSMSELVAGLMSFRGELQKVDVLTTKKSVEHVQKQLNEMSHTQQHLLAQMPQMFEQIQDRIASSSRYLPANDPRRLVVAVPRRRVPKW